MNSLTKTTTRSEYKSELDELILTFKDQDNNIVYKNSLINDLYIHEECLKGLDYMTAGVRFI